MSHFSELPRAGRVFVAGVVIAGVSAALHSVYHLYTHPIDYQWFILAGLTLLTGSFTVKVPAIPARISVSETFVFASVLLFGTASGTVTVVLDALIISLWFRREARSLYRVLFNMAAPAVAIWVAAETFFSSSGIRPFTQEVTPLARLILPLFLFTVLYFVLNSFLVAIALGFERTRSPIHIWRENFLWLCVNYFGGASVASLLVAYTREIDLSILGIIVPLLVISYLTFKTSMGRVEDATVHLQQLNHLYLSTIETLAMAIDAKDQITHGHIRRVQLYAVGLARVLGVREAGLIKAIEAAALLHDMGKLAVPEYILNKPGKLTPSEFEKMKLHASVGADILSAIDFPYPVVPIVRHHHENWDGTGYPTGLSGTDIPIGARILSVVDCFDALTSDRPYRPRLSDDEALKVLLQRRGLMYDPLVVDAFVRVHKDIAPRELDLATHKNVLSDIARSSHQLTDAPVGARLDDISASTDEMLTLYELARSLAGQATLADAGDLIANRLRRMVPATLCAFFLHDPQFDDLVAAHASGEGEELVKGVRIPLGQRLSGWVAANRQTIVNSDPTLDLGDVVRSSRPRLRSCLSTPLLAGDTLVGVLTLYGTMIDGFTEDHRRIVEVVARQISHTVLRATEYERARTSSYRDTLTGLPNLEQLKQFIASESCGTGRLADPFTLLFVDVNGLKAVNQKFGRAVGDRALSHVVTSTRRTLRAADILFRYGSDEFVVVLTQTDAATAARIASRITVNVQTAQSNLTETAAFEVSVSVAVATAPVDGGSLHELIATAKSRLSSRTASALRTEELPPAIH